MQRLEAEKEGLERDLSFKADQAQQYDGLLAAVRENNRQLQVGLLPSSGDVCDVKRKKVFSRVQGHHVNVDSCSTQLSRLPPQVSLKETIATQRALESELSSSRSTESSRDFRTRELEGRVRTLEKENEVLRQKVTPPPFQSLLLVSLAKLTAANKEQARHVKY